ncbi:MAG: hypothetical protein AAFQ94_15395 [Bacteroidota bacterium]
MSLINDFQKINKKVRKSGDPMIWHWMKYPVVIFYAYTVIEFFSNRKKLTANILLAEKLV